MTLCAPVALKPSPTSSARLDCESEYLVSLLCLSGHFSVGVCSRGGWSPTLLGVLPSAWHTRGATNVLLAARRHSDAGHHGVMGPGVLEVARSAPAWVLLPESPGVFLLEPVEGCVRVCLGLSQL